MKKSAIENQFKEKINEREIIPSKASWDRLDAMLTVHEKPKKNFRWMYVAASFLGFLLLGTFFFNQNQKERGEFKNSVVTHDSKVAPETSPMPVKLHLAEKKEAAEAIKKQLVLKEIKPEMDFDAILSDEKSQGVKREEIQEEQIPIINQKAEQQTVQRKSGYVNVDELLASVDNASPKKSAIVTKSNVKVNSNELLSQVDGELDLTFREKAIKTVNHNFRTVKLALSNRNSE